ncbi:MAG: CHASE2 domain-containing protein [Candidatus Hydrogenedentes bacterium]|nr:CHASE2 domain-containing protein [Candidatus Hydrogenedentota bacterium]
MNHVRRSRLFGKPKAYKGVFLLGLLLAALLATLFVRRPWLIQELDHLVYDTLLRTMRRDPPPSNVVIVDIDEASLRELGQWPWPRYQLAFLVKSIASAQPQSLSIDMMLSEVDRTSLVHIREDLERNLGMTLPLTDIPADLMDNDRMLAQSIKHAPSIMGTWFSFEDADGSVGTPCSAPPVNVVFLRENERIPLPEFPPATSMKCPNAQLLQSAHSIGFLNSIPDSDGRIRRMPLLISMNGGIYPSLALATTLFDLKTNEVFVKVSPAGIECVRIGQRSIPTDRAGNMLLRFSGPGNHFQHISAAAILRGEVSSELLKDKVILLGTSATALRDVQYTPFEKAVSGVELHALAMDMMLRQEYLHSPSWEHGAQWVLALVLGVLVAAGVARLSLVSCAFWCGSAGGLSWFGSQWLLSQKGVFISPVPALSALAVCFVLLTVLRFWHEERRAGRNARALAAAQSYAIGSLTSLAETRDPETGRHIVRTQLYVQLLVKRLARDKGFRKVLPPEVAELIPQCAPLHDVGKVGIPDCILQKPGKLTDEEFQTMKTHTTLGYEALRKAHTFSPSQEEVPFLELACEIAYTHHERWDGKGYPRGLKEEAIPIAGRIMALADVYDALTSKRCYKEGFSHERALEILTQGRGTQFDPRVVDAFLAESAQFETVAKKYADT